MLAPPQLSTCLIVNTAGDIDDIQRMAPRRHVVDCEAAVRSREADPLLTAVQSDDHLRPTLCAVATGARIVLTGRDAGRCVGEGGEGEGGQVEARPVLLRVCMAPVRRRSLRLERWLCCLLQGRQRPQTRLIAAAHCVHRPSCH